MFGTEIDFDDRRVPLGICGSCRTGVYPYNSTKKNTKKLELVHNTFDFIKIVPATRSETLCTCKICTVAKGPVKAVTGMLKKHTESTHIMVFWGKT